MRDALIDALKRLAKGDESAVASMATAGGMTVTLLQVQTLFAAVDVTQQNVWAALGRLGLQRIAGVA